MLVIMKKSKMFHLWAAGINRAAIKAIAANGTPLIPPTITESTAVDCKIFKENLKLLLKNKIIKNTILSWLSRLKIQLSQLRTKNHVIFLADSGYDTKEIRAILTSMHIKPIIKPNNRNTKDTPSGLSLTPVAKPGFGLPLKKEF